MPVVFAPKETEAGETRVAATPETVAKMVKSGLEVRIERGAGEASSFLDPLYQEAGATLVDNRAAGLAGVDLVLAVATPTPEEARAMPEGCILVSFLQGALNQSTAKELAQAKVTSFAMELVPRTTRAQKMDALSSQANIAGYKAVLLGATHLGKMYPLMMTAAGTIRPAKVVIFGVGVAGLQAIATAKRLGAIVFATDIRAEVKEQVESLGGKFIEVQADDDQAEPSVYAKEASDDYKKRQAEAVAAHVAEADVVITTAQIPGRKAPMLIPAAMVESMKQGAVIVDIAVSQGGNCELSEAGKVVVKHGVTLVGIENLPATVATDASDLYARNVLQVVQHLVPKPKAAEEGGAIPPLQVVLDFEDEITDGSIAIHQGEFRNEALRQALDAPVAS
jgi:proton-translocating NAD(P)+ transhydrogenase subunit alpha